MRLANPLYLRPVILAHPDLPIVLLHCWPYHRNAGYLAHVYPHVVVDTGLAVPFVGARATEVLGEFLELAPFDAVVYSSDGRTLPETHHLGAVLWRHHFGRLLDSWLADDVISIPHYLAPNEPKGAYPGENWKVLIPGMRFPSSVTHFVGSVRRQHTCIKTVRGTGIRRSRR